MTDCGNTEIRELLPDMLHDSLAPEERQRVTAHISACATCREEFELLQQVHALSATRAVNVGAIAAAIAPYQRRRWMGTTPAMRVAASIAIVALGVGSYSIVKSDSGIRDSALITLASDTTVPAAVAADPIAGSADINLLDAQEMQELLARLESKLEAGIPVEPRPLVKNPKVSGNLE